MHCTKYFWHYLNKFLKWSRSLRWFSYYQYSLLCTNSIAYMVHGLPFNLGSRYPVRQKEDADMRACHLLTICQDLDIIVDTCFYKFAFLDFDVDPVLWSRHFPVWPNFDGQTSAQVCFNVFLKYAKVNFRCSRTKMTPHVAPRKMTF